MAGSLRITGGKLVRQKFNVPPEADQNLVRPASDRVREAIFSSLKNHLPGATVLDLFAGSGAYSFEALSRGASKATLIEKSASTYTQIKQNIQKLKLEDACELIRGDALNLDASLRWHDSCHPGLDPGSSFNLIFIDPPYTLKLPSNFWVSLKQHLAPDSLIIFRCHKKSDFELPDNYQIIRDKTYGGTWVGFLKQAIK